MTRPVRRVVVVDDEPGARADLVQLLVREPDVTVVGEAGDIETATRLINQLRPDLIFLDIQLGQRSGFELLDLIEHDAEIVFVTAHDQYAIRAFEVNAVDYLLKPVVPARLREALNRSSGAATTSLGAYRPLKYEDWLFLPVEQGRRFLRVKAISHIVARGDYTEILSIEGHRLLVPQPLSTWETRLPATHFLRIHRGTIINLERVERVEPWSNHTYHIHLSRVAEPLTMSRNYARRAEKLLQ
jgi:two-component system LytT family response regulator